MEVNWLIVLVISLFTNLILVCIIVDMYLNNKKHVADLWRTRYDWEGDNADTQTHRR